MCISPDEVFPTAAGGCRQTEIDFQFLFVTCTKFGELFLAAAGAFFAAKLGSLDFLTCIRLCEVFPAAAGVFFVAEIAFLGFW